MQWENRSRNRTSGLQARPWVITQLGKLVSSLLPTWRSFLANIYSAARYFKNYKLDYPNTETNKASKKYVKAMKKLPVGCSCL